MKRARTVATELKTSKVKGHPFEYTIPYYNPLVCLPPPPPPPSLSTIAGIQIDSGAAKRFIRSSLWEADQDGSRAQGKRAEEGASKQGSAKKKRKKDTDSEER